MKASQNWRTPALLLAVVGVTVVLALAVRSTFAEQFRAVDLTNDDLISLYNLSVNGQLARRYEWDFNRPQYVRAVLDRRDAPGQPWRPAELARFGRPVESAIFVFKIEDSAGGAESGEFAWLLKVRMKVAEADRDFHPGLSTSTHEMLLPRPGIEFDLISPANDPRNLLQLNSGNTAYRIRLERSDTPFRG